MVYRVGQEASAVRRFLIRAGALVCGLAAAFDGQAGPVDPAQHWPLPPGVLEARLPDEPLVILEAVGGVGGVMGVKKLSVRLGSDEEPIALKWKEAPPGDADGWNNTPRKELAAYEIQKWFLEPADYVVPTTVVRCLPLEVYGPIDATPRPNLSGTRCVTGALTVWINDVGIPDELFDPARFSDDPHYRHHMANFNLLTYLIEHEDGRDGNFLVSDHPEERRIFSVDNGVAFGARVKNWFVPNWHKIRVPSLRRETIEKLRTVTPENIERLGVLVELRVDADGILRPVPAESNLDPSEGARSGKGWLQLGLDEDELEDLAERLEKLLARVDAGKIAVH